MTGPRPPNVGLAGLHRRGMMGAESIMASAVGLMVVDVQRPAAGITLERGTAPNVSIIQVSRKATRRG